MKQEVMSKAISANLVDLSPELQASLVEGLKNIPINKMLQQVQYLQQQMLPQAEAKFGRDNENYRFYAGIVDTLIWAMFLMGRYEEITLQLGQNRLLLEFYQERCLKLEQQLQKYAMTEDLLLNDGINTVARGIANRLNSLITPKP